MKKVCTYVPSKKKSEVLWYVRRVLNWNENFFFRKSYQGWTCFYDDSKHSLQKTDCVYTQAMLALIWKWKRASRKIDAVYRQVICLLSMLMTESEHTVFAKTCLCLYTGYDFFPLCTNSADLWFCVLFCLHILNNPLHHFWQANATGYFLFNTIAPPINSVRIM